MKVFLMKCLSRLLTNQEFDWTGAHTVKVYKVGTSEMNDYNRNPVAGFTGSRYGTVADLDATTEEFTLKKDRSFTFAIDKLDKDETGNVLEAGSALSRQLREKVIPEVDTHTYSVMCTNAGIVPAAVELTNENICMEILKANTALDNAEVPENGRRLVVTPDTYLLIKQCKDIIMETDIGNDLRLKGVVAMIDGAMVIKVPANRLPEKFGFLLAHPCATVSPTKLSEYKVHEDAPGISGTRDVVMNAVVGVFSTRAMISANTAIKNATRK